MTEITAGARSMVQHSGVLQEMCIRDSTNTSKTEAYLKSRGIHPQIIAYCIQHGLLFQSENGNDVIFVGYDTKGTRRYAALRSMTTDYKGEATGSDKHFSFALVEMCIRDRP